VQFDQRDSSGYPLVCELANIALNYYKGRTIANSPSLRTADASSEDAGIASLWRSIALMRKAAPRDVIMTYYGAIKGDVAQSLGRIVEADDAAFDNEKTQLENRINNGTIDLRKLACLPVQLMYIVQKCIFIQLRNSEETLILTLPSPK